MEMDHKNNAKISGESIADNLLVSQLRTIFAKELAENPAINTEWFLNRFIRARKYNMKEVIKMLEQYFKWRKNVNMNKIMNMDPIRRAKIRNIHESGFCGVDREGRPIIIERFMLTDIKAFLSSEYDDVREAYMLSKYERFAHIIYPLASQAAKKRIDSILVIYDLKGVNFSKFFDSNFKKFVKFLIGVVQDNYPEMLAKLIMVNVSVTFRAIWAVIKHWMDKQTLSKMELHGGVPTERLLQYIDIDTLPDFLGGNNKTPIKEDSGPWKEAYHQSVEQKTFFLKDRTPEYEYFYTEEEREKIKEKKTKNPIKIEEENNNDSLSIPSFNARLETHEK